MITLYDADRCPYCARVRITLAEKGIEIDRRKIVLAEPIKNVGEFEIPVKLGYDVTATVKVTVVAK